jgi:AbrB family looped-hinge helix DNA binding protein
MRADGIVRRVDDLGRVVIPREIRMNMGIREGEPMEIYVENDTIMLRKYSHTLTAEVTKVAKMVEENCNADPKTLHLLKDKFREIAKILKEQEEDEK